MSQREKQLDLATRSTREDLARLQRSHWDVGADVLEKEGFVL